MPGFWQGAPVDKVVVWDTGMELFSIFARPWQKYHKQRSAAARSIFQNDSIVKMTVSQNDGPAHLQADFSQRDLLFSEHKVTNW